jgi:purine-binding chemotaxis protein CheW
MTSSSVISPPPPSTALVDERSVLEARARALATPVTDRGEEIAAAEGSLAVLVFRRGGEHFAVPLDGVVDVRREVSITPLPGVRTPVVGVTTWRGRVLTVVDVGSGSATPKTTQLIVVGEERASYGICSDETLETRLVPADVRGRQTGFVSATAIPTLGLTADAVLVLDWLKLRRMLTE